MPNSTWSNAFDRAVNSKENVFLFLFATALIGSFSSAIYDIAKKIFGEDFQGLLIVLLFTSIVLYLVLRWIAKKINSTIILSKQIGKLSPAPRKGLIFLVGRKEVFEFSIQPHLQVIEKIWLIHTAQTEGVVDEIKKLDCLQKCPNSPAIETRFISNPNDPDEFFKTVRDIYATLPTGFSPQDVISDYVGMTAHASVGMVLACLNFKSPIQFTPGKYNAKLEAIAPEPPFEVIFQFNAPSTNPSTPTT